jgi:hypothetical protein
MAQVIKTDRSGDRAGGLGKETWRGWNRPDHDLITR